MAHYCSVTLLEAPRIRYTYTKNRLHTQRCDISTYRDQYQSKLAPQFKLTDRQKHDHNNQYYHSEQGFHGWTADGYIVVIATITWYYYDDVECGIEMSRRSAANNEYAMASWNTGLCAITDKILWNTFSRVKFKLYDFFIVLLRNPRQYLFRQINCVLLINIIWSVTESRYLLT